MGDLASCAPRIHHCAEYFAPSSAFRPVVLRLSVVSGLALVVKRTAHDELDDREDRMKALPHHYDAKLRGGPSGYAQLSTGGTPALPTAPPVEFDGPGDAWSPEHLLLASVQA